MLAAFLQYFGFIYGLLLGLLAVATYHRLGGPQDMERWSQPSVKSVSRQYRLGIVTLLGIEK